MNNLPGLPDPTVVEGAALLDGFEGHCEVVAVSGPVLIEEFGACVASQHEMDDVTELFQAWRTDCGSGAKALASQNICQDQSALERVKKIVERELDPNQTTKHKIPMTSLFAMKDPVTHNDRAPPGQLGP